MGQASKEFPWNVKIVGWDARERGYIRKGTPRKKARTFSKKKETSVRTRELPCKGKSTFLINARSILELARGRVYTELLFYSLLFVTLVPLALDLRLS